MNLAILKQLGKFCWLVLVGEKKTRIKQFQALLEGGLLADLLDANIDEVNREEFRRVLGFTELILDVISTKLAYTTPLLPIVQLGVIDSIIAVKAGQGERAFMLSVFRSMETNNPYAAALLHNGIDSISEIEGRRSREDFLKAMADDNGIGFAVFASSCLMYKMLESQAEANAMNRDFV